jgi:hypothetical protein
MVTAIFFWDFCEVFWGVCRFGLYGDSSKEVLVSVDRSWYVFMAGRKFCFCRVICADNNRELSVIDPPLFPIDIWLFCGKPGIPQDCFMVAEVGQEEPELSCVCSGADLKVRVISQCSCFVFGSIDIDQFAGVVELFNW